MEIFEMARLLGIPEQIINKKPTADLWDGQTDEDELGLTYARIDEILKSPELNTSDDSDFVKVRKMIKASEHKRNVAPSYKKLRRENENSIGGRCSERFYAWWQSCYRGWR
jgi:NAD+ synthase